jgi:5-methylcytosine-specific restriction endonuclease McrA
MPSHTKKVTPYKKKRIPVALRQQVWIQKMGRVFEGKCKTPWCKNTIYFFSFECGHKITESKGGATEFNNLFPICRQCNVSMSNTFTFDEWCKQSSPPSTEVCCGCWGF